jgi:hypothetical protein
LGAISNEESERTTQARIAQLKELNERSRTYGRQLWQLPLAYLAGAGVAILQAADLKRSSTVLVLTRHRAGWLDCSWFGTLPRSIGPRAGATTGSER